MSQQYPTLSVPCSITMKLCCSYLKVSSTKTPLCSPHIPHIPNHVSTMIQSTLLLFHTRRSQCLTIKKQVLKSFFPFRAIAISVSDNSVNIYFLEIFNSMVSAHSTLMSLLIYTTIPQSFLLPQTFTQLKLFSEPP